MNAAARGSNRLGGPPSRAWMRRGLCFASPTPDLWFPEAGQQKAAGEAQAVCRACPVSSDCLAYALALGIGHGVWGGTTPDERDGRKARRRYPPARPASRRQKTQAEGERRRRLREAAKAGDRDDAERIERELARKRTAGSLAAARDRAWKARAAR